MIRPTAPHQAYGLSEATCVCLHFIFSRPHYDTNHFSLHYIDNKIVEPTATKEQWFVDAKKLSIKAKDIVNSKKTNFFPANWSKTYFQWMNHIEPWCISRQLWWGHQIPAWYGPDKKIFVALNEDEAKYLSSTADLELVITDLLQICPTIVIKRGSHGVIAANRGSALISLPAISAQVIDTTGAGDSFAAGFIAADQAGLDFTQSLGAALTIAAKCVAIVGARPALDAQV